jgi:hypothetical protein
MAVLQNARLYWEMFGGVGVGNIGIDNLWVRALDLEMDIGGWAAVGDDDFFQVSIYGRATVDSQNLVTLYQEPVKRPAGAAKWKTVKLYLTNSDTNVRCVVVKVELTDPDFVPPDPAGQTFGYADQYETADAPAWGLRIKKAAIYGSRLGRNVRPELVLADILDAEGYNEEFTCSAPTTQWTADQLSFSDIPKDRQEGIDDIVGMTGWNYGCWDGAEVEFAAPASGTAYTIDAADPRTTWSVTESFDETYNAVRVQYTNPKGKPREVIEHRDTPGDLLNFVRADCLQAPESIKSEKSARRFAQRYLFSHARRQVAGNLTIVGDDGVLDALLIRPGDTITMTGPAKFLSGTHEVTSVTLNPLEWSASVQFGSNSKRFDTWLARLAAGAKSIRRR